MSPVLRSCHRHRILSTGRCPQCQAEKRQRQRAHTDRKHRPFRLAILERDGYRCHWCGDEATTLDYVLALVEGGTAHDPNNAVAACGPCNSRRGAELVNG